MCTSSSEPLCPPHLCSVLLQRFGHFLNTRGALQWLDFYTAATKYATHAPCACRRLQWHASTLTACADDVSIVGCGSDWCLVAQEKLLANSCISCTTPSFAAPVVKPWTSRLLCLLEQRSVGVLGAHICVYVLYCFCTACMLRVPHSRVLNVYQAVHGSVSVSLLFGVAACLIRAVGCSKRCQTTLLWRVCWVKLWLKVAIVWRRSCGIGRRNKPPPLLPMRCAPCACFMC